MSDNIIDITLNDKSQSVTVKSLFQWDYGISLRVKGFDDTIIPQAHFAFDGKKNALMVNVIRRNDEIIIPIPNSMLMSAMGIWCYLYYERSDFGLTKYTIHIPVRQRAKPNDFAYTETQITQFNALISELNTAKADIPGIIEQEMSAFKSEIYDIVNQGGGGGSGSGGGSYILPTASSQQLGGVRVGSGLKISSSGILSVDVVQATQQDNTRPITSGAVYTQIGNIEALLNTI